MWTDTPGTKQIRTLDNSRSAACAPTLSGCTTCLAMSTSGAQTNMAATTMKKVQLSIHLAPPRASIRQRSVVVMFGASLTKYDQPCVGTILEKPTLTVLAFV